MGSITTGIGLVSGIDTASLIDSLIALESAGKFRLQERVGLLQAQQTALLDVNARLLAFKAAAGSFRLNDVFDSMTATSSNADVLTASARTGAQPGSYTFIVKQLVTTSQQLSRGFATADATPLGLDQLSFEFGQGRLAKDRALEDLNGGAGVERGRIVITDRADNSATIDLTDVTSIEEVIERINASTGVDVTASIQDDHLVITDTSGGSNDLTVADGSGHTTATDLGIAGTVAADVLTGTSVYYIGAKTALSSLNDGNGVLVRDNVADLSITARDGTSFTVDFGRIDLPIDDDTLLADLNNGNGVTLNGDEEDPDVTFVARDGTEYEVDLTGVTTLGQLRTRVSTETGGHLELSITDGERLTVTDTIGGAGLLKVTGAGANDTQTAEDLGILEEDGVGADFFDGALIPNTINDPAVTTIQGIIDRINAADGNGGAIVAALRGDGLGIELTDTTGGGGNIVVASTAGNPTAAADLGIETAGEASATLTGERLVGGLGSVLVRSLNGGDGLGGTGSLEITDRAGMVLDLTNGLLGLDTLDEIIDKINSEAQIQGVDVTAALNASGNGVDISDTSGATASNLVVTGDAASNLGIEADVAADVVRGTNLQLQYVSEATRLEDLNNGRGVGTGGFRITDGLGNTAVVSIGGSEQTLYDVILEINSRGLAVQARVNDNGDGLIIEEDAGALGGETPFVPIKVEAAGGTTARDLNILGTSSDIEGGFIDGSYERVVDLDVTDSLDEVVAKINDAGVPVSASVLNTGGGATPFRLSLTSGLGGRGGDLVIDAGGVDLGLSVLTRGQDAKVFFGAENPEDGFLLTSSTNTLDDVLEGVTIDLVAASDDPVTVSIERDDSAIVGAVRSMVTAFNDAMTRIKQYDFFDVETEERGLLLGDATMARVRTALYAAASGPAVGVDGSYRYLSQVGLGFGSNGEMTFDESAFREAYEGDPASVEELFAAYEFEAAGTEEVAEGVTVESSELIYTSLGFGNIFDNLLDRLTNSIDGVTTLAEDAFEGKIALLESRIETMDERLDSRRDQLTREFTAMETALARLQSQSNALASLASSVSFTSSLLGR